jgi:hypothetical protein
MEICAFTGVLAFAKSRHFKLSFAALQQIPADYS